MKKPLSLRLRPVVIDLLDKVAADREQTRTALIEDIFMEFLGNLKGQEIELAIRKEMEISRVNKRVKEIERDLRKYNSRNKIQNYIDTEKYVVALAVYNRWKHYYLDIVGKPLNPPVDIKSL